MLLNDLVLKRSSVAGVITGKLSDFSGLLVAPVLVMSIARPKSRAGALVCVASVVAPFVAIKVSSTAASLLVWGASLFGLKWRIWSDWTDLAALVVLPLAWRIGRRARAGRPPNRVGLAIHRAGALLGALACVATSENFLRIETTAYLVNFTYRDVHVLVFRAKEPLDCAAVAADPRAALRSEHFAFEECWTSGRGSSVPLAHDWREISGDADAAARPTRAPRGARACDAVVIRVEGLPDTAVFWNEIGKCEIDARSVDKRDAHAVHLEQLGDALLIEGTPLLDVWPVDFALPEEKGACRGAL
ncbi:MAG: hypothetical protein KF819_39395 [Labilithrix sp.]|nr:hypothetical protein [Labilithrix sp.]